VLGGGITLLFSDAFKNLPEFNSRSDADRSNRGLLLCGFSAYRLGRRRTLVYSGRALVFVGTVTTVVDLIWLAEAWVSVETTGRCWSQSQRLCISWSAIGCTTC